MRPHGRRNDNTSGGEYRGGRGNHGGHRHGRGRHHGMGSQRVLTRAELRLLLLSLMTEDPRHGYELIRGIKSLSQGAYAPSPGLVYPALAALQEGGQIAAAEGESLRKVFAITPTGQAEVAENADALAALKERLEGLAAQDEQQNAPIRRAMANLEMVLANALAEPVSERSHAIVTLIDETARTIERLD